LNLRSLLCLALIHTLVDGYAQVVAPLWPGLQGELGLGPWALAALVGTWQLASSVSQPLFGYWGDRFGSRWLLGLGPALGVVGVSLVGLADGPLSTALCLVVGGLGIGAFHPEAAVRVVEAAGEKTTRGLALFTFGGMIGLGLGPLASGALTARLGLPGLAWGILPGLLLLAGLLLGCQPSRHALTPRREAGEPILGGRGPDVLLLLGVSTLRVIPALGVPLGLAFLLSQRGESAYEIGRWQSLFLLSGGAGTLLCPLLVRKGRELNVLIGLTVAATGALLLLLWDHPWASCTGLAASGLLLQGAIPILIAYSQRLLPNGQRLAASLTLGASWGLGGLVVAALQAYFTAIGRPEGMLWAMVPFSASAAVAATFLPRLSSLLPAAAAPAAAN
jgi:FSR family fosmidomycin resistance protein-like MFS transporter